MYVCMYVCMYVYMCMCVYVCIYMQCPIIYVYLCVGYVCICMFTFVCMHMQISMCVYIYVYTLYMGVLYVCMYVCMCVCVYISVYLPTHLCSPSFYWMNVLQHRPLVTSAPRQLQIIHVLVYMLLCHGEDFKSSSKYNTCSIFLN